MKKMGGVMSSVGNKMTLGLTLPIVAAGGAMIKAASDLEESINAVNVVFGESGEIIKDYGETVATTAGLSQAEFSQMAAVTGAFLKNVGFDAAEAADKTIELTERASDMASIFNTDVSQALEAIQSGLKGEFNPLEQFGVKLNAAAIEARALSMGLANTKKELTDSHKATAALALVMEQTEQFAGDFANTSDGLANSTKILKAQFTDMAAKLGNNLLPMAVKVVAALSSLVEKFNNISPTGQKMILTFLAIVAAAGPLLSIVGSLLSVISAIGPAVTAISSAFAFLGPIVAAIAGVLTFPLIAIILAVIAAVALLVTAWKNDWGGIQEKATKAAADIDKSLSRLTKSSLEGWKKFGAGLKSLWSNAWENIKLKVREAGASITAFVASFINRVVSFFTIDWRAIGANIVKGLMSGVISMAGKAISLMQNFASSLASSFTDVFRIGSDSKLMIEYGGNIVGGLVTGTEALKDVQLGSEEMLGGSFQGSSNSSTTVNLTLPSGIVTKTMMGDILGENEANISNTLTEAMAL